MLPLTNIFARIRLLALILLMSGCSLMSNNPAQPMSQMTDELAEPEEVALEGSAAIQNERLARLYQQYSEWRGVKYKMGGMSKQGVDCSGFVRLTFADLFSLKLPRDTILQARGGVEIDKGDLRSGDLVFFRINKRTQHVGIYLEESRFVHASTSRGVMISSMTQPYWQKRYWKSVRHEILS